MAISFMPFSDLSFLMLVAEQQDLNIFLDNIDAVSAREM